MSTSYVFAPQAVTVLVPEVSTRSPHLPLETPVFSESSQKSSLRNIMDVKFETTLTFVFLGSQMYIFSVNTPAL